LGNHELKPRFDGAQPDIGPAAATDEHLVPVGSALEVVAEVVPEFVSADV